MSNSRNELFRSLASTKGNKSRGSPGKDWVPVTPVPETALSSPSRHAQRGSPSDKWTYRNECGDLLGYVWRFDNLDGNKEFVFLTWCCHSRTKRCEWRFKAWSEPRPLYGLHELAQRSDAPVLIVEGEKCVEAAGTILDDWVCITSPGGSNAAAKADWSRVRGRRVTIWPDADETGEKYADAVATSLIERGVASVHVVRPPQDVANGWDIADAVAESMPVEEIVDLLEGAVSSTSRNPNGGRRANAGQSSTASSSTDRNGSKASGGHKKQTLSDRLVDLFLGEFELWRSTTEEAHVTFTNNGSKQNWPLRSRQVRSFMAVRFRECFGQIVGGQALEDALRYLEALAFQEASVHKVWCRTGRDEDCIYVDLVNENWEVVKVSSLDWEIVTDCPIKFCRTSQMQALPEPVAGEPIDHLRGFVNVADDQQFKLIVAWLVAGLYPLGPYPIIMMSGEQGSGKSNLSRFLRLLVDPNSADIRSMPKDERNFAASATNSHCLVFDNLSSLSTAQSDMLCRVSTGGGFSHRKLYEDTEEVVNHLSNPVLLNGITEFGTKPGLLDRSMAIHLPRIPDDSRMSLRQFEREFEAVRPAILGALLTALSVALRHIDGIKLDRAPRMADFATLIEAAAPGLGWEQGEFLTAYNTNRNDLVDKSLDQSPLAAAIKAFMHKRGADWKSKPAELYEALSSFVPEETRKSSAWPKSPVAFGSAINRVVAPLRKHGIDIDKGKSGDRFVSVHIQQSLT